MILTKSKAIEKVRDNLNKGIFKTIRLLKIEGEEKKTIFPWNKIDIQEALNRLDWIEYKLDKELGGGIYEIQCKMNFTRHGLEEKFRFEIKDKKTITLNPVINKIEEPQTEQINSMHQEIDFEDYVKLIKENAELKAQMGVLQMERDFYKKISNESKTPLSDPIEKTLMERAIEGLSESAPTLLALANEFFEQRGRKIAIEEKKLNLQNPKSINKMRKIKNPDPSLSSGEETREQIAERLSLLSEVDNDQFNMELDQIEQNDPDLYEFLCESLQIEDSEEE